MFEVRERGGAVVAPAVAGAGEGSIYCGGESGGGCWVGGWWWRCVGGGGRGGELVGGRGERHWRRLIAILCLVRNAVVCEGRCEVCRVEGLSGDGSARWSVERDRDRDRVGWEGGCGSYMVLGLK